MIVHKLRRRLGLRFDRVMVTLFHIILLFPLNLHTVSAGITVRQAIPKFLLSPTNVTVHKGELAVLQCYIRHLGPKMVTWRKASDEHPLTIGETTFTPAGEISVDHDDLGDNESRWNLLIKNVKPRHAGVYECQISDKESYTHYVALNVIDEPLDRKPQLSITGTMYVAQSDDINLKCNATGVVRAPQDVDWFFEGNKINPSNPKYYNRVETYTHRPVPGRSYISELIIHRSTREDQGSYVCRSSDLNFNSIKVHVLNADKDTLIVPRAPGDENKQSTRDADRNSGAARVTESHKTHIIIPILIFIMLLR